MNSYLEGRGSVSGHWVCKMELVLPWRVDADWNVCLEAKASLTDVWVPLVELSDSEVVVGFGNAQASIRWLDSVECRAVRRSNGADLDFRSAGRL